MRRCHRWSWVLLAAALVIAACDATDDAEAPPTARSRPSARTAAAALPEPRTEVVGVAWDGALVVLGGLRADGGASARADRWDPQRDQWEQLPPLPVPVHHAGAAVLVGRLYVVGGYTNKPGEAWRQLDRVVSLGSGERSWRNEPRLLQPRAALGVAELGDRLVAVGGVSGGAVVGTAEVLVSGAPSWRPGPRLMTAREHLAVTVAHGRVWAIGGRVGGLDSNLRTVESSDGAGPWRPEPDLLDARGGTAAAAVGDVPCVAGGEEPRGTIGSVECLRGGRWQRAARLARPRHGLAVVALNGRLHAVAGGDRPGLSVTGTHEILTP